MVGVRRRILFDGYLTGAPDLDDPDMLGSLESKHSQRFSEAGRRESYLMAI
jgi:hypothetical protein